MPSFRRRASVLDADHVEEPPQKPDRAAGVEQARARAEEAEAEAAEAEAMAAAARARARAVRLRRQALAGEPEGSDIADVVAEPATETDADADDATETATEVAEGDTVDTVDTVDEVVEAPDEEPWRTRSRWTFGRILKVILACMAILCTCALIAVSVIMVILDRQEVHKQQQTAEYAAAGRQSVVTLMSLDFNKAQEDVQRIIDNSTGQFKTDFENQAADFVKVAQESKVITDVTVNATGVESMTDSSAVVLVSATSRVTNSAGAQQEPRSWRLSVNLQKEGDQIKMSKVEFVP